MESFCCPHCHLSNISKAGFFYRKNDSKTVQRYICNSCRKKFSQATIHPCYKQKKRKINYVLKKLLASGVTQRRCALILNLTRKTVSRKLKFLARIAREEQKALVREFAFTELQMDDLLTCEHTKCKPLSVTVVIDKPTRTILALEVAQMPAFGHLAKISRAKYGKRKDQRQEVLDRIFEKLSHCKQLPTIIESDEHKFYPPVIKKYFPLAEHKCYPSIKSAISGQGELKKCVKDPLFYINHTLAMLRANVSKLIRKTWSICKKPEGLKNHLDIYVSFHNQVLIKK